jgi:hypothetical protein
MLTSLFEWPDNLKPVYGALEDEWELYVDFGTGPHDESEEENELGRDSAESTAFPLQFAPCNRPRIQKGYFVDKAPPEECTYAPFHLNK